MNNCGGDEFSDNEDEILTTAIENFEASLKPNSSVAKDEELGTPLERFRPGYLWVSDLTRQNWCEQQVFYSFTVPAIVEENPVMTEGSSLHLARELAVHDVVQVKVTSSEDIWAIKVLNLLSSLISLLNGQTVAREIPIFGAPFDEDVFIVGLIDELRFDPTSFQLDLWEFKTRKYKSMPSKSQQAQNRLQVMLYKKLFDDLVEGKLTKEVIAKHLKLNMNRTFGSDIQATIDDKCLTGTTLNQLLDILFIRIQCITCIKEIGIEYEHQGSKESLGMNSVDYDDEELEKLFKSYLEFWRGRREVKGVEIEEAWKCQSCDFADICDWRKRKAEQYSQHGKKKI
ncbi:exonuclease V-like [Ruditapes philippinarum]|uniref:exonuclease V-like n=1 Tax=Ruditapes philippinarum TaxID=129788 RepID=UPI00295B9D2E|nr:exonuclease V-like [Ruditapes philippinarum]